MSNPKPILQKGTSRSTIGRTRSSEQRRERSHQRESSVHCGRGKGMLNGWLFNWVSTATREMESLETCCVENLLVVYVCVSLLSLIDAKRHFLYA